MPPEYCPDRHSGRIAQPESVEELVGAGSSISAAEMVEPAEHHEILPAGEDLVDGSVLPDEADPVAHLGGVPGDVVPGDLGAA